MNVYILGPMRGIMFYNFEEFDNATRTLRESGHTPISPADIDRVFGFDAFDLPIETNWNELPSNLILKDIVARDINYIINWCDSFTCLQGWEDSDGARAEKALCEWLGYPEVNVFGELV
jgi:hypothetical protein